MQKKEKRKEKERNVLKLEINMERTVFFILWTPIYF